MDANARGTVRDRHTRQPHDSHVDQNPKVGTERTMRDRREIDLRIVVAGRWVGRGAGSSGVSRRRRYPPAVREPWMPT